MLILIRGLPGSGKSTFAREYFPNEICFEKLGMNPKYIHLEADMYFTDNEGNYNFNRSLLRNAHSWCQETAKIMMNQGLNVIVSNTFTTLKEMQFYLDHAKLLGIEVWVYHMTGNYGSIHNVPEETIEQMRNRFEDYEDETLI